MRYFPGASILHYGGVSTDRHPSEMNLAMAKSHVLLFQKTRGRASAYIANLLMVVRDLPRLAAWSFLRLTRRDPASGQVGAAFLSTMGVSIGARYATNFGLRELAKLIPVYGQTVGAATAGAISFATTYALGRAAAYFLYRSAQGSAPSEEELRKVYQRAFRRSSDEAD